jgi:hypothetical protein
VLVPSSFKLRLDPVRDILKSRESGIFHYHVPDSSLRVNVKFGIDRSGGARRKDGYIVAILNNPFALFDASQRCANTLVNQLLPSISSY